jgi:predicted transcriptional regulator
MADLNFREARIFLDEAQREITRLNEALAAAQARVAELEGRFDPDALSRAIMAALGSESAKAEVSKPEPTPKPEKTKAPSRAKGKHRNISDEKLETYRPVVSRLKQFTSTELAKELDLKDSASTFPAINALLDEGFIRRVGKKGSKGVYYILTGQEAPKQEVVTPAPKGTAPAPPEQGAPDTASPSTVSPEDLKAARDYVTKQKLPFYVEDMEVALHMKSAVANAALASLFDKGIVQEMADGRFTYQKPTEPGAAALLDLERRKTAGTNGYSVGVTPVSGTGRGSIRTQDKDVQEILDAAQAKYGRDAVKHLGSGHWLITGNGHKVPIANSPNSSGLVKDLAKARKLLGLNV